MGWVYVYRAVKLVDKMSKGKVRRGKGQVAPRVFLSCPGLSHRIRITLHPASWSETCRVLAPLVMGLRGSLG